MKNVSNTYKIIKEWLNKNQDAVLRVLFIIAVCIFGTELRFKLFPKLTDDINLFLTPWYYYIEENNGFAAVSDDIGDYTPMYYYFLAALTYTNLEIHIGIKLISVIFDFIMSLFVMKIVQLKDPADSNMPVIAFGVTFCLPTVVLNSAAWAQCDVIYTTFLVMSLYYMLKGKDRLSMIMLGISFSFKIQAIFLTPLIGILVILRKIRWRTLLWIPIMYIISIIPAAIAGGDFMRLLTVYFKQSEQYPQLTLSLANIWSLLEDIDDKNLGAAGIYFAGICVLIFMYYYITRKNMKITPKTVIGIATLASFIVPFVLPHMHERYMYFTEIMFVIFAFYYRKRAWLIATTQFCSVQCLLKYLYEHNPIDLRLLALIEIINAAFVFYTLHDEINSPTDNNIIEMDFEKAKKSKTNINGTKAAKK